MRLRDFDARKIRIDVSCYAPPHARGTAGDKRPVRERLSRGASHDGDDGDGVAMQAPPPPMAVDDTIHVQAASPRLPLSVTGRLAVAMTLIAGVTVASAAYLQSNAQSARGSAAGVALTKTVRKPVVKAHATDLPKTVHTVMFRPSAATVGDGGVSTVVKQTGRVQPSDPALPVRAAAAAPPKTETAPALTAPLKVWAMFPDTASGVWHGAAKPAPAADATAAKDVNDLKEAAAATESKKAAAKNAVAHHHTAHTRTARHARHHHYRHRVAHRRTRHHRTRTAAAKPKASTQAQASATEPVKKTPIQAALDKLFGGGSSGGDSGGSSGGGAPAAPRAAFR